MSGSPALLTIDVQLDFSRDDGAAPIDGTEAVLPAMRRLVEAFREQGRPIVHVVRLYLPDGSNAELSRRDLVTQSAGIVAPGSEGSRLDPALVPPEGVLPDAARLLAGDLQPTGEGEWLMFKPRWGAFYATPLEDHLRSLGVDTVVIAGANFPNCPRTTLYEASERDFHTVLVTDALSRIYERGIAECAGIGAQAKTVRETAAWLGEI